MDAWMENEEMPFCVANWALIDVTDLANFQESTSPENVTIPNDSSFKRTLKKLTQDKRCKYQLKTFLKSSIHNPH